METNRDTETTPCTAEIIIPHACLFHNNVRDSEGINRFHSNDAANAMLLHGIQNNRKTQHIYYEM